MSSLLATAACALSLPVAGPAQVGAQVELEGTVRAIAFEPGGARAWVVLDGPGALVQVDAATLELRARRELPGRTLGAVPVDGGAVALVNAPDATLVRVGGGGDARRPLGGRASAIERLPDGRALVTLEDGRALIVELETLAAVAALEVSRAVANPSATGDGRKAFVACEDGALWALDLWNERLRGRVEPGGGARAALVLPGGVEVAVVLEDERALAFVNVAAHELLGRIPCERAGPGAALAATPDGRRLFVGEPGARALAVVDLDQRAVLDALPLAGGARTLAVAPDGRSVWIGGDGLLEVLPLPVPAPRAVDAGDRERTELCLLATIQRGHLTSARWGLGDLRETIRRIDPDVVCVEIPPDRWRRALLEWRSEGRVEEPRVQMFPEYTMGLFPLLDELEFTVVPCSAWSEEMNDLRRARILAFRKEPDLAGQYSAYESEVAEVQRRHAAAPIADDDPFVLHSDEFDRRAQESMGPYDRYMNHFLGPGGWTNENRAHLALIEDAIARHPQHRILVLFGADHRYWFQERLRQRTDVALLDPRPFLPGAEARMDELPPDVITTMEDLYREEVVGLHRFFEGWMRGELADTEAIFRRFQAAMGEGFEMVTPDGTTIQRPELVARLRAAHGSHAGEEPPFRIWIEKLRSARISDEVALVTYQEWQESGGVRSARVSTALLRREELAPAGVSWTHLHETWLDTDGPK